MSWITAIFQLLGLSSFIEKFVQSWNDQKTGEKIQAAKDIQAGVVQATTAKRVEDSVESESDAAVIADLEKDARK